MKAQKQKQQAELIPTCTHWGNYLVEVKNNEILAVHPYDCDKDPTPIGQSLLNTMDPGCRIPQPMIRQGYLENGVRSNGAGRLHWDNIEEVGEAERKGFKYEKNTLLGYFRRKRTKPGSF